MTLLRILFAAAFVSACSVTPARQAGAKQADAQVSANAGAVAPSALEQAVAAAFAGVPVKVEARDDKELRDIVVRNVDRQLSIGATAIDGEDVRFTPADGIARQAGVIRLRYPDEATAAKRPLRDGFFKDSKILIPMALARSGETIAIFYSESGGDPAVRALLRDAAVHFQSGKR